MGFEPTLVDQPAAVCAHPSAVSLCPHRPLLVELGAAHASHWNVS